MSYRHIFVGIVLERKPTVYLRINTVIVVIQSKYLFVSVNNTFSMCDGMVSYFKWKHAFA